mmetsp:Transcript_4142/g.18408  ORF Transcript_4142/g.18408 Transcript_4142/m.18408 type:complete len:305 (-) Transcript_4142:765-1679(-)
MSARCLRALSPCATPASAPLACIAPSRSLMNPCVSIPKIGSSASSSSPSTASSMPCAKMRSKRSPPKYEPPPPPPSSSSPSSPSESPSDSHSSSPSPPPANAASCASSTASASSSKIFVAAGTVVYLSGPVARALARVRMARWPVSPVSITNSPRTPTASSAGLPLASKAASADVVSLMSKAPCTSGWYAHHARSTSSNAFLEGATPSSPVSGSPPGGTGIRASKPTRPSQSACAKRANMDINAAIKLGCLARATLATTAETISSRIGAISPGSLRSICPSSGAANALAPSSRDGERSLAAASR